MRLFFPYIESLANVEWPGMVKLLSLVRLCVLGSNRLVWPKLEVPSYEFPHNAFH